MRAFPASPSRRAVVGALVLAAAAGSTASTWAVPDEPLLAHIDFEDRETATADWSHVFEQAPGLPRRSLFFDAVVDEAFAASGGSSLRLDLDGGSISYRMLPEASIALDPDADYRVTARVATEGLQHSIVRLEARVVDGAGLVVDPRADGDVIADSTLLLAHSEAATWTPRGQWSDLEIRFSTDDPRCAESDELRLFVALQVVQPGGLALGERGPELVPTVRLEDIEGTAWFDDLEIRRSARLRIEPATRPGIVSDPGAFETEVVVDDPAEAIVSAEVRLEDVDGVVVDRVGLDLASGPRHRLRLGGQRLGWHRLVLETRDRDDRVGRLEHGMVAVPAAGSRGGRESPRFGLSATDWDLAFLGGLETVLDSLDPDVIELPMWPVSNDDRTSLESVERVRRLLDRQRRAGREPIIAIDRLHGGLAATARVETAAVRAALEDDPEGVWASAIGDWMLRLGTSISRWRVEGGPVPASTPPMLASLANEFVADPVLLFAQPFDRASADWGGDEPCFIGGPELASFAQTSLSGERVRGATVVLAPPPADWTPRARLDEAARRGLAAWVAGAGRTMTAWNPMATPDPSVVAISGLGRNLGGVRPFGELAVSPTARCLLGDGESGPVLVAWSELEGENERIEIPVGYSAVDVEDLDGTRRSMTPVDGRLLLDVGSTPRFVHGADRLATVLAASARFEPTMLDTDEAMRSVRLMVRNPLAVPIEVDVEVATPPTWSITPDRPSTRVGPGDTAQVPLEISWTGPQLLGTRLVPLRLVVRSPRRVELPLELPLEVHSSTLQVDADWSLARGVDPATAPVILQVDVENIGDRVIDVELVVTARRAGRETRTISTLAPESGRTRRLRLRGGFDELVGSDVRIEVREIGGPASAAIILPIRGEGALPSATAVVQP